MLKYLLLIALAIFLWWNWQKRVRGASGKPRPEVPAERMVSCARCGIYLPESESLVADSTHYCCENHRRAGQAKSTP